MKHISNRFLCFFFVFFPLLNCTATCWKHQNQTFYNTLSILILSSKILKLYSSASPPRFFPPRWRRRATKSCIVPQQKNWCKLSPKFRRRGNAQKTRLHLWYFPLDTINYWTRQRYEQILRVEVLKHPGDLWSKIRCLRFNLRLSPFFCREWGMRRKKKNWQAWSMIHSRCLLETATSDAKEMTSATDNFAVWGKDAALSADKWLATRCFTVCALSACCIALLAAL